jgi:hypothetical protein
LPSIGEKRHIVWHIPLYKTGALGNSEMKIRFLSKVCGDMAELAAIGTARAL